MLSPSSMYSSHLLWVQHITIAKTFGPTKVSIEGCSDVDDFLNRLYEKPLLSIPQNTPITIYKSDGITEIIPTDTIKSLGNMGKDADAPLVVKTTAAGKSSRLVTTRKLSVEASYRNYLDAIAFKLSTYYVFKEKSKLGATFGDVLEAIKVGDKDTKPRWSYILETDSYEKEDENGDMVQIHAGDPKFPTPLPSLFTDGEWAKLRALNKSTSSRIHSAILPSTSNGKAYVIIPHSEFNEEMVSFLKNVGVKATLFSSPDDLEVKDADLLFDS
jgi:hypothetical protein